MLRAGGPLAREDSVMSGKYEILRCGAGIANSNAAMLQELLPQVWQNLQAARTDAQLGTTSVHGFTSFFKSNDNKATVNAIFGDISAGSEVVLNPDEAVRAGKQTSSPILVCLNAEDSLTQGLYHYMCTNENGYGIGHWQNSELIALCPKFFKLTAAPTANLCPSVLHNSLVPNDHRLLVNQYALFVYQLAHLYIPWHKRIGTATSQVTSYIQAAADANVVDSVGRPDNYAFYAAGKRVLPLPQLNDRVATSFLKP